MKKLVILSLISLLSPLAFSQGETQAGGFFDGPKKIIDGVLKRGEDDQSKDQQSGKSYGPPVAQPKSCTEVLRDRGLKKYDDMCKGARVSKNHLNDVTWDEFFTCVDRVRGFADERSSIIKECSYHNPNNYFNSSEFNDCINKTRDIRGKRADLSSCLNPYDSRAILSDGFDACYNVVKQFKGKSWDDNSRFNQCNYDSGQKQISCLQEARKYIDVQDAWDSCSNHWVRNRVSDSNFSSCFNRLKDANASKEEAFNLCAETDGNEIQQCVTSNIDFLSLDLLKNYCKGYEFRRNAHKPRMRKCISDKKESFEDLDKGVAFCSNFSEKLDYLNTDYFKTCTETLEGMGISAWSSNLTCSSSTISKLLVKPEYQQCVKKGIDSGIMGYFYYRESELQLSSDPKTSNAYYYVFDDCKVDLERRRSGRSEDNDYLSLYRDYNIHSHTSFQKAEVLLGGLSAVRLNPDDNSLYILSDDRGYNGDPRIYVYDYKFDEKGDLKLEEKRIVKFEKKNSRSSFSRPGDKHNTINMDPEGFDFMEDGRMIVSSELDDFGSDDYLTIFKKDGEEFTTIEINDLFKPRQKTTKSCNGGTRSGSYSGSYRGNDYKDDDLVRIDQVSSKSCFTTTYSNKGLQLNKSFESLSVSPDKNFMFTANEAVLNQDRRVIRVKDRYNKNHTYEKSAPDVVRIVKYQKDGNTFKEREQYFYELEDEKDNGLVEITALSDTVLLTLERSWDSYQRKLTSRIFLVNLNTGENVLARSEKDQKKSKPVEKKLVLDLDDIKGELSPGFRRLENLEGMTIGPKLPNGKDSLIMVADNNFSTNQRTLMLMFEVNVEKLLQDGNSMYQGETQVVEGEEDEVVVEDNDEEDFE